MTKDLRIELARNHRVVSLERVMGWAMGGANLDLSGGFVPVERLPGK